MLTGAMAGKMVLSSQQTAMLCFQAQRTSFKREQNSRSLKYECDRYKYPPKDMNTQFL